jgi:hypothetical protein
MGDNEARVLSRCCATHQLVMTRAARLRSAVRSATSCLPRRLGSAAFFAFPFLLYSINISKQQIALEKRHKGRKRRVLEIKSRNGGGTQNGVHDLVHASSQ